MLDAKQRVASGDLSLQAAVDWLREDVAAAMAFHPVSVTDKGVIPPSGERRDYVSRGPYWWPNPDAPNGLPYVRRDGERNPEADAFDAPKMRNMRSAVEALSLGQFFFDDLDAAHHAVSLLRAWFIDPKTGMNPHLEYGQGVPGVADGRPAGIIETSTYCRLIDALGLLEASGALSEMDRADLLMWMKAYRDWLLNSELGKREAKAPNNHATWYDAQVCALALYTGDPRIVQSIAERAKEERIATQIEPDGSQPHELARTRSNHYCVYNLHAYTTLACYASYVDSNLWQFETEDGKSIQSALDWIVPYALHQEVWSREQIVPFSRSDYVRIFLPAAAAYGDGSYRQVIDVLNPDSAAHRDHLLY